MVDTWSFILIPDTQKMANPGSGFDVYFNGMRDWIIANREVHNIKFVGGLGDIIDRYGDEPSWQIARTALDPLFDLPIPVLLLASGNHDSDTANQRARSLTGFNHHFGVDRYENKPWFGGVYEDGKAQNLYALFAVGEIEFLAFMLEFHPRAGVYEWVEQVAAANPGRKIVIFTHAFQNPSGVRDDWTTAPFGPSAYFTHGEDDATSPEDAWQHTLKHLPGLFGVFSGHHLEGRVSYRIDPGHDGPVVQGFYNWQQTAGGGYGRLILMTVDERAGTIRQQVVRPDLDGFETLKSNGFDYDIVHPVPLGEGVPVDPPTEGLYAIVGPAGISAVEVGGRPYVVHAGQP